MKSKIYSMMFAVLTALGLWGCDDWNPSVGDDPGVQPQVSTANMQLNVNEAPQGQGRAGVDVSGFTVTVTDRTTGAVASWQDKPCSWAYSAMPQVFTLPVGDYTVTVKSHTPAPAAWDEPYYEGSAQFSVENNRINYIGTVTCDFRSLKVGVRLSDEMAAELASDARVEVAAGAAGAKLTWTPGETRNGYFAAAEGNPTILATFTGNVKGQQVTTVKEITDAKPGCYYIFSFSLATGDPSLPDEYGNISGTGTGVKIDFEIIEGTVTSTVKPGQDPSGNPDKHPDAEEWPETPDNPDDPTPPADEAYSIVYEGIDPTAVNPITGDVYKLNIKSQSPMTHLYVEIISDYLTTEFLNGVGITTKFDLAYPAGTPKDPADPTGETMDLTEALEGFRFPIGNQVIGATDVTFDLTQFIPLLGLAGEPMTHTFRLTLNDEAGNEKTIDLRFKN